MGDAVERFSLELRRPRCVYINYAQREQIETLLQNRANADIDLIVVTDGEGVLGIGDQGIGGMDISIAKLMVYALCAGINPHRVLAVQLDVGTNNEKLLNDPMYLGWRQQRISGAQYDEFIDQFVTAVRKVMPKVYLHWEDFGRDNARKNLNRYRQQMCTFNDDMQGTGIVTLANVISATAATGQHLSDHRIIVLGAGTAGVGIADQLYDAMCHSGLSPAEARERFWLLDRDGLLLDNQGELPDFQQPYIRRTDEIAEWSLSTPGKANLIEVVCAVRPTILIGCSTLKGAFTEAVVKAMAQHVTHPIIMPLSSPTSHAEAEPKDIVEWTEGRALIAAGSPFPPVTYQGKTIRISQGNNAFVFPGLGLGVIISQAKRMTDKMIFAAAQALRQHSPALQDKNAPLLPDFDQVQAVSHDVALAVAKQAIAEGVSGVDAETDLAQQLKLHIWQARYYDYKKMSL